ncbi:MAG: DUF1826 domain-containing protein [Labilithrix sp.]
MSTPDRVTLASTAQVCVDGGAEDRASSTIRVAETIELTAVFEPHVNVVVLERSGQPALRRYADRVARETTLAFTTTAAFAEEDGLDGLDALTKLLPADDARDVLLQDIAYWIEVLTELTGVHRVGVRLLQLKRAMCPGFHVDRVPLRFVCTYHGPTSQWLLADAVDRSVLAGPRIPPEAIRRDAAIQSCAPLDVVLLKGSAWPGNALGGAVHRSPPSCEPRLLLTLDPLD